MDLALIVAVVSLALPQGEQVSTDCFRGAPGTTPSNESGAELRRTDEALEVRVWRRLGDGERPKASGQANPPETMFEKGGDTVEVLIEPDDGKSGVYYHFIANPSNALYRARGRDASWNPAAPVSSRPFFERNRWGVDFILPYAALGVGRPKDGDVWRANFAAQACNWAGVSDFHMPAQFGRLVFGGEPPEARVESVARDADGTLHVSFAIPPRRASGEIPHKSAETDYDLRLLNGGKQVAAFEEHVAGEDADYLTLDRFYCPAGERFRLTYAAKGLGTSVLRIRRLDGRGAPVEFADRPASGELELGPLESGDYAFEVDDGRAHASCQFEVAASEVRNDAAAPHYPVFGSEYVPSEYCTVEGAVPHWFTRIPVTGYIHDRSKPIYGAVDRLPAEPKEGCLYRLAYEAQMAVLLRDGKEGALEFAKDRPGFYIDLYRQLKAAYPRHRFSIHIDNPTQAAEYAKACDVFEYASRGCSYSRDLLGRLHDAVADLRTVAAGRPAILWLGVAVPGNGRWRTADELNTAIRYCVLKGLAGNIFHLGHGGVPKTRTRLWSAMRGSERAVNAWYPDWTAGEDVPLKAEAGEGVEFGMRRHGDRFVLIAVNLSRFERILRFEDPLLRTARTVRLPGCGSLVQR